MASVPTAAQERAPHLGEIEVLRLHLPQTLVPSMTVPDGIALRVAFQGLFGSSRGGQCRNADHPT